MRGEPRTTLCSRAGSLALIVVTARCLAGDIVTRYTGYRVPLAQGLRRSPHKSLCVSGEPVRKLHSGIGGSREGRGALQVVHGYRREMREEEQRR